MDAHTKPNETKQQQQAIEWMDITNRNNLAHFDCMCAVTNFIWTKWASMLSRLFISCLCEALPSTLDALTTVKRRRHSDRRIMLKMVARAARFYFNTFTVVIESPSAGIAFFVVLLLFGRVDSDALHRSLVLVLHWPMHANGMFVVRTTQRYIYINVYNLNGNRKKK